MNTPKIDSWPSKNDLQERLGTGGMANYDEGISKALGDDCLEARGGSQGSSDDLKARGVVESPASAPTENG